MVTENTLEVLNKEVEQKPKVERFFNRWKVLLAMVYVCALFISTFFGYYQGTIITSNSCESWKEPIVYAMNEKDLNYLTDKNTFVQGLNALYQVNNEEHQIIWQGIQDLNKQLNEIKKGV